MIFRIILRPRRVYKGLVILFSAVLLYRIVYQGEFSAGTSNPIQQVSSIMDTLEQYQTEHETTYTESKDSENLTMKYILIWTPTVTPFNQIRKRAQVPFISNDCEYTNCFLTHRRDFFPDQTKFDAVLFSIAAIVNLRKLPLVRSPRQKFIATSIEPPQQHPVVNPYFDGYFNWTWTYRLDSDVLWRKFIIYDHNNRVVGPRKDMKWKEFASAGPRFDPVLSNKRKSVVWLRHSCKSTNPNIIQYIVDLEFELKNKGLSLVIYSNCSGSNPCGTKIECEILIREDFYFYLAFEDYFDEDYVTDTLLFAVNNYAVPIVIGSVNYSRFLPPGSYVDATNLTAEQLAQVIDESMTNFTAFRQYFGWVFLYGYESTGLESEICNLCAALNNEEMVKKTTVYDEFRKKWNGESAFLFSEKIFDAFHNDDYLKNMLNKEPYYNIRNAVMRKVFPDYIYVFDMENLNLTTTEGIFYIPDELTSETTSNIWV